MVSLLWFYRHAAPSLPAPVLLSSPLGHSLISYRKISYLHPAAALLHTAGVLNSPSDSVLSSLSLHHQVSRKCHRYYFHSCSVLPQLIASRTPEFWDSSISLLWYGITSMVLSPCSNKSSCFSLIVIPTGTLLNSISKDIIYIFTATASLPQPMEAWFRGLQGFEIHLYHFYGVVSLLWFYHHAPTPLSLPSQLRYSL